MGCLKLKNFNNIIHNYSMDYLEEKVWGMLQSDEQVVLSLLHGQESSVASVAQMLNKRTYQVRRLNYQAIKMFRLFYRYFEEDPSAEFELPGASPLIRELVINLMKGHSTPTSEKERLAIKFATSTTIISAEYNEYLEYLKDKYPEILVVIRECDRYRKRFLPLALQWPSPYRRKRNRAYKNLAIKLFNYDSYTLHVEAKLRSSSVYIPMSSTEGFWARKMPFNKEWDRTFTDFLGIPYFKYKDDAVHLAKIIREYYKAKKRTPNMGRIFMKDLRITLEKADNYKRLFHIPDNLNIDKAFIENSGAIKQYSSRGTKRASKKLFN